MAGEPTGVSGQAVAYIRVSTEEQAAFGSSLAMQEARLADYCRMQRLELVETISDKGVSGSIPFDRRPGGRRLVTLLAEGQAKHIVALKLDRLFRDAANALNQTRSWDKAGVSLHLVDMGGTAVDTSSAMGRMFLTMMAGYAEFERNVIGERTRSVLSHKRIKGEVYAPTPLGFRREGDHLVRDHDEQQVLARIRAMAAAGTPLNAIARTLNAEGIPTKQGRRWYPSTLKYMLAHSAPAAKAA